MRTTGWVMRWGWLLLTAAAGAQGLPELPPTEAPQTQAPQLQPFQPPVMPGRILPPAQPPQSQPPPFQPPANQPPPSQTAPALPAAPSNTAVQPVHRARVSYALSTLEVTADNSSLNQILRDVARLSGMKISGGVADERVYGTYGPGDVSAVLAQLLAGTGSNMLLILDSNQAPSQLLLTARQGGPTPPSPSVLMDDDRERDQPDVPPAFSARPQLPPAAPGPAAPPQAIMNAAPVTPETPAVGTTTDQSPNGVKTPQQIYDQLMKLQQQKPINQQ